MKSHQRSSIVNLAAALLLLVFLCELTLSIRHQSLSWDEGDHIYAGYQSWKNADFGINPEHPPLVKAVATIPMLFMDLKTPPPLGLHEFKNEAYFTGRDLIFQNGGLARADHIIFSVRMAAAFFSLLLALLVFLAGKEMFGSSAALISLTLLVFEPNLIAHGAYVTTDMGISCLMFATFYVFYRYVKAPSTGRLLLLGVTAGFALAAKHSGVLLLPMALVVAAAELLRQRRDSIRTTPPLKLAAALGAASAVAIILLWACYGFRYAARPAGLALATPLIQYASGLHGFEPRIYLALARWHLLPESYLYGLVDIRIVSNWFPSYVLGQVHAHGVWFYFPVAFAIKATAAFMALMLILLFSIATRRLPLSRELLFFGIPPVLYLLIAAGTGLNIGARHILPMFPFLCVLIGAAVVALSRLNRRWAYATAVLVGWHVISTTRAYPVYIAYSNEFWGGPDNTYKYLTDSNTDWGQQLHAVKQYVDAHGIKDCWFAYFVQPAIQFSDYQIPCRPLPTADTGWFHEQIDTPATITGPVFISAGTLTGYELGSNVMNPYRQFQQLKPTAVIQHGVFVFDGTFDTRFASALGHVTRANDLTNAKQLEAALAEAQQAVAIDPQEFQAQMVLADTLSALHRKPEADTAYRNARTIAATMEPTAKSEWTAQIDKKLATP